MNLLEYEETITKPNVDERVNYVKKIATYSRALKSGIADLKNSIKIANESEKLRLWQLIEAMKKKVVGLSLMERNLILASDERWKVLQIELIKNYPELKYYQS